MAPIWNEDAKQQPGLPKVTVAPKHDDTRMMKGVEWVWKPVSSRFRNP